MENLFCAFAILWCPPYNVEFVDSSGECVYVCVDGVPMCPCVTGPFDNIHEPEEIEIIWSGTNAEPRLVKMEAENGRR